MSDYRALSPSEIKALELNSCTSTDWSNVLVDVAFRPSALNNVHLSGAIRLGTFTKTLVLDGGLPQATGITNAKLHNCTIDSDVYIRNINGYIANYHIQTGVIIDNVDAIITNEMSSFGNGTRVKVLNENGGRPVPMYDELSAQTAYLLCMYRHHSALIDAFELYVTHYTTSIRSNYGTIKEGASLRNCGSITNVNIGSYAKLEGVVRLTNGTINSNGHHPSYFGTGVMADHFISATGATVSDGAIVSHCFVGQGCTLSTYFSALHSLFFANSEGLLGEACHVFAGPYTLTHHKSTLLIAGYYSFFNAGSGTNQSNHMYKMGPVHQGIMQRGCKTSSDAYLLWPAHIGAFTMVMGRHYHHANISHLPFSYLLEEDGKSILLPAVNLKSIGTYRDAKKWPIRDARKDSHLLDCIEFRMLNPSVVEQIIEGKHLLENLIAQNTNDEDMLLYQGVIIPLLAAKKGIELYQMALINYLGNQLSKQLKEVSSHGGNNFKEFIRPHQKEICKQWVDISGLIISKQHLDDLIDTYVINTDGIRMDIALKEWHENYAAVEWAWCHHLFQTELSIDLGNVDVSSIHSFLDQWDAASKQWEELIYADAMKEYSSDSRIGYGLDEQADAAQQDFDAVRGLHQEQAILQDLLQQTKLRHNELLELKAKIE